jgi:tetratricopeptide (TPR) repeat protein
LKIAVAMQVILTEGEQAKIRQTTNNLEVWSLSVKADTLFESFARDQNAKAREFYQKALELAPNYLHAWTYLGWTYYVDGLRYYAYYNRNESLRKAEEMARKALSIDNNYSEAIVLLSNIYLFKKMYDEAVTNGRKAIALDPGNADNHGAVAIVMQYAGEFNEAIALIEQGKRIQPYYPAWYENILGACYFMLERYEESAEALEKMIHRAKKEGGGKNYRIYLFLAATYSKMGRLKEAQNLVAKSLELNPKVTVKFWRKQFLYKNPAHTELVLDALRKAGLPE